MVYREALILLKHAPTAQTRAFLIYTLALENFMDTIKPLFTATDAATGGRNGHTQASDGSVSADLSVAKAMGGPGKPGMTTPEHLFAAGYAACFPRAI